MPPPVKRTRSDRLFAQARRLMPGGVNSPVRAFGAVGGTPRFVAAGRGAILTDVDGRRYVDYVGSWGPLILGHAHPAVVRAVAAAARRGTSFGAPTAAESQLARLILSAFPAMERLRLVSSGTEACMSAIRAARGFTGRERIVKFNGGYHGHSDGLLVSAGSGALTFGVPSSAGVPRAAARLTASVPYNTVPKLDRTVAAVIVEPVAGNAGVVAPAPGFLEGLRRETRRVGALLIFDEVITGFRLRFGPASDVEPDLTTWGKIVGGGLPLAAYGGRARIMRTIAPEGPVYQAGTLSGNPVATAAGLAALGHLKAHPGIYRRIDRLAGRIEEGVRGARVARRGSMFTVFVPEGRYPRFFHGLLERGIWFPPSQFEAAFVGAAHTEGQVDRTIRAINEVLAGL
jgi:glutamate-1-semialdehyde 2,1-aminomutase